MFDIRGRARRRRLRALIWVASAFAVLAGVLGALAVNDVFRARAQLVAARSTLQGAINDPAVLRTPAGRAATVAQIDAALVSIEAARSRIERSPVLSASAAVPVLRGQRNGLVDLISDSNRAATAGRDLLEQVNSLAEGNQLRDGALPVDGLKELQRQVRSTGEALQSLVSGGGGLWGPLGRARADFDEVVGASSRRLIGGADALGAAVAFMGASGERNYLVALQNNAEMRDQGMVLSYVPVRFTSGRLSFESGGSVIGLALDRAAPTPVPDGTRQVFGEARPTQRWQAVNATADFAFSGRAMADMYRQATGRVLDGVIAIDVPGLGALLRAVGPVTIAGAPEPLTADNVGRILLHDFYEGQPNTPTVSEAGARQEKLVDVLKAVIQRLTTGTRDAVAVGRELGDAAKGGHLRVWSSVAEEEAVFERTGLGGGPGAQDADRTFHLAVENRSGTKVDYYVKPAVRMEVSLTPQGAAVVRTTVTVDNQAPITNVPSYQLGPDEFVKKPGDYLAWILLWGPAGSMQQSGVPESGLNLSNHVVPVSAGEKKEISFETVIPDAVRDGRLRLRLVPQARLVPAALEVRLDPGNWKADGALTWSGPWDSVRTVEWEVRRP